MNMKEVNKLKKWFLIMGMTWAGLVLLSCSWNIWQMWDSTLKQGINRARMAFKKDVSYRLWNASHGGVYVPITSKTRPNKYLKVPHRDVVTTGGKKLTLVNPAYMTRQVFASFSERHAIKGRITSLKLVNPTNAPDDWEKKALLLFQKGKKEISEMVFRKKSHIFVLCNL